MSIKIVTGPSGSGKSKWAEWVSREYGRTVRVSHNSCEKSSYRNFTTELRFENSFPTPRSMRDKTEAIFKENKYYALILFLDTTNRFEYDDVYVFMENLYKFAFAKSKLERFITRKILIIFEELTPLEVSNPKLQSFFRSKQITEIYDFIVISQDKDLLLGSFKKCKFDHVQMKNGGIESATQIDNSCTN